MTIVCKILIPIIYSLFIGGAYSNISGKRFGHSLMLAYCIQILLLLLSGMVFKSLLVGIAAGVLLALAGWCYGIWHSSLLHETDTTENIPQLTGKGGRSLMKVLRKAFRVFDRSAVAFIVLALIVFVMNYGKLYYEGDEFSHWGRFLKECCRLDQLYVMSPGSMAHKDYVPAVTLFEYLWCKLSLAYSEANAYRGIQMLLVGVVLAVADEVGVNVRRKRYRARFGENSESTYILVILLLLGIPLLFSAFRFYHSIYEDAIFGILMFYGIWIAMHDRESIRYRSTSLTLALTILIMSKMTAAPFAVLIWLFYLWNEQTIGRNFRKAWKWQLLPGVIPVGLWVIYNRFAAGYVDTSGGQSYGGIIKSLLGVLQGGDSTAWQITVEISYWKTLLTQGLIGGMPFAFVAIILIALLVILGRDMRNCNPGNVLNVESESTRPAKNNGVLDNGMNSREPQMEQCGITQNAADNLFANPSTGRQLTIWLTLTTIAYVLMMAVLYVTSFSEYEALQLASYDRYMSSWLIAMVYVVTAVILTEYAAPALVSQAGDGISVINAMPIEGNGEEQDGKIDSAVAPARQTKMQRSADSCRSSMVLQLSILIGLSFIVMADNRWQLLSGIQGTELEIARYDGEAALINSTVDVDETVLIIERGSNGLMASKLGYYCLPRVIGFSSPGPDVYDGDEWSTDLTPKELTELIQSYGYVYIVYLDDAFLKKYREVLPTITKESEGTMYRVEKESGNLVAVNG